MSEDTELLEFPCAFPIKAMGLDDGEFEQLVVNLIARHADVPDKAIHSRPSRNGKYLAVTVTVEATSRRQLDAIYYQLSGHEKVLMAL